jgi:iron complex outermembrane receptor protein
MKFLNSKYNGNNERLLNTNIATQCFGAFLSVMIMPNIGNASNRLLEEVVVTAQKREENSQDVPITMLAMSGEKLESLGVETTADLQKITPGLTFTKMYGYTVIYLRGIGSESFLPNSEPSIATYVDDINLASGHGSQDTIGPIERIEVLKGPQGTLYGRSATGGAISIVSKAVPVEGYEGSLTYGMGNYDDRHAQAYLAAAVTDSLGVSFAYYANQREPTGGTEVQGKPHSVTREDFTESYRLKLTQYIGENFSVTGIAQKSDSQIVDAIRNENIVATGLTTGMAPEPDRFAENDRFGVVRSESELLGLIVKGTAGPVDLKFIYSDQNLHTSEAVTDYDGSDEARTSFFTYDEPIEQETFELQFSSNQDSWNSDKLTWVAGYFHLEGGGGFERFFYEISPALATNLLSGSAGLPPLLGNLITNLASDPIYLETGGKITIESDSVFAEANYEFTDRLNATFGVRYQEETRGLEGNYFDAINPAFGTPPESYFRGNDKSRNINVAVFEVPDLEDESVAPRLALQYFVNDEIQVYTSLSRGFKSQTYNILNFFSTPDAVDKSATTAIELGFKSELLDGTLRLNSAIFKTVTENDITAIAGLTSGAIVTFYNAGETVTEGLELDFLYQPFPNLNPGLALSGGASYIEAEYSEFLEGRGYDEEDGLYYGPSSRLGNPARDFSGNDVPRSPTFSSNLSINQFISMGDFGDLEIGLGYAFKDNYFFTASNNPRAEQPQFELFDARVSWMYEPSGITLSAYINNIKNEQYFAQLTENDYGVHGNFGDPKTFGAKLKIDF